MPSSNDSSKSDADEPTSPSEAQSKTLHFESKDGAALFGTIARCSGKAKANVLIIHGYADHGGRYGDTVAALTSAGLNAMTFDLRGHGRSGGDRGYIKNFEQYLEDVEAALAQLGEHGGDLPVMLVGHSNGGLIALHLLADPFRCPPSIQAAVISSPFLALKIKAPLQIAFAKVASRILPKLALPNKIASSDLTHDPEKIREHEHDTLCHDVASTRWFTETVAAQNWVAEFAHRIKVPTLWLVAGMDQIANPEQTRSVHSRLSSESIYHEFEQMHHEVFHEIDRARVFGILSDFCHQNFDH